MTNPFADHALPTPKVGAAQAQELAAGFGVTGTASPLGSSQDANFRVSGTDGDFVLKVANPAFSVSELELQNAAMRRLSGLPGVEVPVPVAAPDGSLIRSAEIDGRAHHVRLLTFVAGEVLSDAGYLAPAVVGQVGALSARLCDALSDLDHAALDRVLQWDPRRSREVVAGMAGRLAPEQRDRLLALSEAGWHRLDPVAATLLQQPVHADLADYNLLSRRGADGRPRVSGVIDFGDVIRSWRVGDLATAIASLLARRTRSPLVDLIAAARGFHAVTPLSEAEVVALWPLVMTRAAVLAAGVEVQIAADPTNEYAVAERADDWAIVDAVESVLPELAEERLRSALGLPASPRAQRAVRRLAELAPTAVPPVAVDRVAPIDWSVTSPLLDDGRWVETAAPTPVTDAVGLGRHAESRLIETTVGTVGTPTLHLGVDLLVPVGTAVRAPAAGTVVNCGDGLLVLDCDGVDLLLGPVAASVAAGTTVGVGDLLGEVAAAAAGEPGLPPHLHLAAAAAGVRPPVLVDPADADGWLELSPDPADLLGSALAGADAASSESAATVAARRDAVVAAVQQHYYGAPPRIERGWREWLIDTDGRALLDMVNNVAVLGHSHPRVTAAATEQFRLLNTNSRFLYAAMVEFGERIVELMPAGLDTVFFVNSGSEAVDLALRLVRTATGRKDVICVRGGYHGWTTATDEISTSLQDNPNARETRPPWIHLTSMPNTYRGDHRGPDAAARYAAEVRDLIAAMVAAGTPPAAFIAEPLSGNAGGVMIPPGYLASVYDAVRAAGGLAIADEVQCGYGRTGETFWHFEAHGVVPDVVTMAKAVGNGHPVGFVVTRREIAEAFGAEGSFFSSVGGSPVSSRVGLAVLDALAADGLQRNAREVGAHLKARLEELAERHPMIGTIHGTGLYLGVELVRDRDTREPATAEAEALCDRLLELGVICQPTGDYVNVLKVKPPLCLTVESADFFVTALERCLVAGW